MGNTLNLLIPLKTREKSLDICPHCQLKPCSRGWLFNGGDRISPLSDDILLNILSFLTMKEVVKTSLLSRRWRNLWVDTHVLHFDEPLSDDDDDPHEKDLKHLSYLKWVNSVLERHKGRYLKKFKIVCDLNMRHQKDIDSWFVFALARKVEQLELHLMFSDLHTDVRDKYVFPDRFLSFNSGKFDLKCLKSLSLMNVEVSGEAINFVISNCPLIERLEVGGTLNLVNLVISGPNSALKYLKIKECCHLEVVNISNFNMVSLDIQTVKYLTLADLPMLVDLSIEFSAVSGSALSNTLSRVSSCLSQIEFLTLRGYELKHLDNLSYRFHKLSKLRRLSIEVARYGGESLAVLLSIVTSCPLLEEFVLSLSYRDPKRTITRTTSEDQRHADSSLCKHHSLKVFEFKGYFGRVSDDELIKYIMVTSLCLEKVIIDTREVWHLDSLFAFIVTRKEHEAKNNALKQVEALKESASIPPHVRVFLRLRECNYGALVIREIYPHTYTPLQV